MAQCVGYAAEALVENHTEYLPVQKENFIKIVSPFLFAFRLSLLDRMSLL
jgi:hypothetical protein